jgi:hypothetical protein
VTDVPQAVLNPSAPLTQLQGVDSPPVTIDPEKFYIGTRRLKYSMKSISAIAGLGSTDTVQLRQSGIVAGLEVRVTGTIVFGGTITGTTMSYEWPFNVVRNFTLSANGQSNLVKARGLTVRVLEFATNPKIDDTGITKTFNAATSAVGTLALPCDDWGTSSSNALSPNTTVPAAGTYTVDLSYFIPVAADYISLVGSVYAQSSATNLTLDIDWNTQAALLTLGGAATFAHTLQYQVTGLVYSIPNVGGRFVVPDLTQFHQIAEARVGGQVVGLNEPILAGTGVGRRLMRLLFQVYSNSAPLAMNATNYGLLGWAYGGNDTPEVYPTGQNLRAQNVRQCGADIGVLWGFGMWDYASQFALRDIVDEATTADLRLQFTLIPALTTPFAQICQETLFAAPVGA